MSSPVDTTQRVALLAQASAWRLAGRVAVSDGTDGGSGRLEWSVTPNNELLSFRAPLGQGGWRLERQHAAASLDLGDDRIFYGDSLSGLLEAQLGWRVPVESMRFWVLGLPDPETTYSQDLREDGLPARIQQSGWAVRYDSYRINDGLLLPRKLVATRAPYSVKLVVSKWETFSSNRD